MLDHHKHARLARAGDRMPWHGRLFGYGTEHPGYEVVDLRDGFTLGLLADGSILLEEPPTSATEAARLPTPDP